MNMKGTRKIMRLAFLGFLVKFLTKRITLALAFVLMFVMISAESAECTPSQLPVNKNLEIFTKKVKFVKIEMSDQIFNDTTVEVNPDDTNAAPVIPLIDLASESGSDNVEILDEVTSTTTPGRSPRQVYNEWSRGLASTSTPTPNDLARARRGEVQAEHLRCLAQENERFYNMFGQPDMNMPDSTWPTHLTRSELKETYARAYAVMENEFPELLELENFDYPHPTAFESDTEGSDGEESDVVAVIPRDSTTTNTVEEPVGSDAMGPVMGPVFNSYLRPRSGYRSPTWPPLPLWQWSSGRPTQEVRPGPIPNARFNPVPSTSSGVTRPEWHGSEFGLVPLNQDAKKLWEKGFVTEVAIGKILAEKAEMSGDDQKAADAFNEALKNQVGRRARFLEVFKNQQTRYESYIRRLKLYGTPLPNSNPGYSGSEVPSGEFDEALGENSNDPEVSVLSSNLSEPGQCSPENCVCNGENCVWENANYTD
jgi:hypothetical protein